MNPQLAEFESSAPFRHKEKMDAVARLAGGLSSDVGSLVDAAAASVRDALQVVGPTTEPHERLEEAAASLQRAAVIARQLRTISRDAPERPRPRPLGSTVRDLLPLARQLSGDGVSVFSEEIDESCWIEADQGQIEQVFFHLVVNARDAMPVGGDLNISVGHRITTESTSHRFGIIPAGSWVVLEIADTGLGMTEEILGRLFEPFFTTKGPGLGSGLGLATVYGIAHQLGGHVKVSSALNRGTRVGVWLPSAGHSAEDGSSDSDEIDTDIAVLVVDDDPWGRSVTGRSLRRGGYGVLDAVDANQAFEILGDVAGSCVGVVLADLRMPGQSGAEFSERLAEHHPGVRVVLTSSAESEVLRGSLGGNCSLLRKPFSQAQLLAAIRGD